MAIQFCHLFALVSGYRLRLAYGQTAFQYFRIKEMPPAIMAKEQTNQPAEAGTPAAAEKSAGDDAKMLDFPRFFGHWVKPQC